MRFNPDGYVCAEDGKEVPSSCRVNRNGVLTITKKWKDAWDVRLEALRQTVECWMNSRNSSAKTVQVVELYC